MRYDVQMDPMNINSWVTVYTYRWRWLAARKARRMMRYPGRVRVTERQEG